MTDEMLRYIKVLQPLFEKMMGPWQAGDKCCDLEGYSGLVVPSTRSPLWVMWFERNGSFAYQNGYEADDPEILRIPLTIDPRNPKRGLWRMVDWSKYVGVTQEKGEVIIFENTYEKTPIIGGCAPTLAILKVLAIQEGVEP